MAERKSWIDDSELFTRMKAELFTAVVGDLLDDLGFRNRFLPPEIRPLDPKMVLIGRAMPVVEADVFTIGDKPFGLMFEALDSLKPGEIYVVAGASARYAVWGELMSTAAMRSGANGILADGFVRDTWGILRLQFPTFCRGSYAQDQKYRGQVIDYRTRIEIGGVAIEPGDLIFGDIDGVLVIPKAAEEEAIRLALEKVKGENLVRQALEQGMSASEAFRKFGIM